MPILIRSGSPGTSARVKTWKLRPVGPARCFGTREQRQEKQQAGASVSETARYLVEGESSEGRNPMSAAGMKQDRHGLAGRKPSRGSPNPEGGAGRAGKARFRWIFDS
jgi:hypothetical protein